jgi:hypothetical protein
VEPSSSRSNFRSLSEHNFDFGARGQIVARD